MPFKLAVIGAGPAGISAVGVAMDSGFPPDSIAWIDPKFDCGDIGEKWMGVPGNTKVKRFSIFLRGVKAFEYDGRDKEGNLFPLESLDPEKTCKLRHIAGPLRHITQEVLLPKVNPIHGMVTNAAPIGGRWSLSVGGSRIQTEKAIVAIGAAPKKLSYGRPEIPLETALNADLLAAEVCSDEVIGVFGSSHSGILAVKNLVELGIKKVVNFYHHGPELKYAEDMGDYHKNENTGLKGEVADWARENISSGNLPSNLIRMRSSEINLVEHLPQCSRIVDAVGFEGRMIPGIDLRDFDRSTGRVAKGLYAAGIGAPERKMMPDGQIEDNIGIPKFARHLAQNVFPAMLREDAALEGVLVAAPA